jgi:YbbR domain-containing protein
MNIREMVSHNFQLKLLSLLLAALLWLFVTLEANEETDIPLAVTCANLPAGLAAKVVAPRQPLIHAVGPRILLFRQRLRGVSARIDLSAVKSGTTVLTGFENFAIPVSGVKFIRVSPVTIDIHPDPAMPEGSLILTK